MIDSTIFVKRTVFMIMRLMIFLFVVVISWVSCEKETQKHNGYITGIDARRCACFGVRCGCCNGYWLTVEDTAYLFQDLPKGSDIDLENATFPIPVKVDYYQPSDSCTIQWGYVIITAIEQQK